jgi:hypothetical protein
VIDERTYGSIVLPYKAPTGPSASSSADFPCRVIPASEFELLVDVLGSAPEPAQIRLLLNGMLQSPMPSRSIAGLIESHGLAFVEHPFWRTTRNRLISGLLEPLEPEQAAMIRQFIAGSVLDLDAADTTS